jgi:DNA-directed RNA polymerase specialized sigma24 family protein
MAGGHSDAPLDELVQRCADERAKFGGGAPADPRYCLEIFRRALVDGTSDAWTAMYDAYYRMVLGWVKRHPAAKAVELRDSLEAYAHEVFERLLLSNRKKQVDLSTLGAILTYLHTSVNWVMLDALRSTRREQPLPEYDIPRQDDSEYVVNKMMGQELWELVRQIATPRELRLAHALWIEGYKPREIPALMPDEFPNIQDVRRCSANLVDRLRRKYGSLPTM